MSICGQDAVALPAPSYPTRPVRQVPRRREVSVMWASFGSLSVVPWILFAQSSWNMDAVPVITAAQPSSEVTVEVRDRAEVFGSGAEQRAREALQRIHREHRIPVLIETIKSLEGAWIADVAQRRGRMAGAEQLYI